MPAKSNRWQRDKMVIGIFSASVVQKMNFTEDGTHEGAIVTAPPGLHDAYFAFRANGAPEKVALIFQVASPGQTLSRLKALGLDASMDRDRVITHDPDGNLLVFTQRGL